MVKGRSLIGKLYSNQNDNNINSIDKIYGSI